MGRGLRVFLLLCVGYYFKDDVSAAADFNEETSGYSFIYHAENNLLLTVHWDSCYYTSVQSVPPHNLADPAEKIKLEIQILQRINDRAAKATSLQAMRDQYTDMLADFHCLNKNVYTLALQETDHHIIYDCNERHRNHPQQGNGVYNVYVHTDRNITFTAYCDQTTDGGGWTVILNRMDGSVDFNQNWKAYCDGFGRKDGEYWLGLDNIHVLTANRQYELRVDMSDFRDNHAYAVYDAFVVDGPETNYVLHVSGYRNGPAGDSLWKLADGSTANGMQFSTKDRDHDRQNDRNCAASHVSGWWYNTCWYILPTGPYRHFTNTHGHDIGLGWQSWLQHPHLKTMSMKIRPKG